MFLRTQARVGLFRYKPLSHRTIQLTPRRSLNLASRLSGIQNYGFIINVFSGAYLGGLIVSLGSLYFLYHDANERQNIPFWDLSFQQQITCVKAINKDDVLRSPKYAVKHYKRLLIELYKQENPNVEIDETQFEVPLLSSEVLLYQKSNNFANFYIDMILRYSKALLAKSQLDASIHMLSSVINDDELFFKLGDTEKLSECCRLLSRVCPDEEDRIEYLKRSILNIAKTFPGSIKINADYLIQDNSLVTDELIKCLNGLAFNLVKTGQSNESLNIYLSNLKLLSNIKSTLTSGDKNQSNYPYLNVDEENLQVLMVTIKSYISEILWQKGYKKNSISWNEEIIDECYFAHNNSQQLSIILNQVLKNLIIMYDSINDVLAKQRCEKLQSELTNFTDTSKAHDWYFSLINRFSRIIYHRGPLGVIEKPLLERFGGAVKLPEIEEIEEEDVE
ncbi:hypothetical protein DFJ63DRAFT_144361 [Scheffersomyces coipomensis]|uniref:uncharacterized protein n=1 Tax=Scheffersomyces coipomensis TaxID=1788519 RepID=UPI00315D5731